MKILRNAATVSAFTALSRVLGLVREILMAALFGTSLVKSAFDLAFRIPNMFRGIFGEGALSAAFVPVYNEMRETKGPAPANRFAGKVLTFLAVTLTTMTLLAILGAQLARIWLPYGGRAETVLRLLAILFPYVVFLCLAATCMGILNSIGRFALPAAAPMLMNFVWILALIVLIPNLADSLDHRITILAWAVVFSGFLQLAFQAAPLAKASIRPVFSLRWNDPQLKDMFKLFMPAALSMGIRDINILVDGILALWIGAWAPAALVFAERLAFLPLGLFATAFGTVLLPTLSRQAAASPDAMHKTLGQAIHAILVIMLPAAAGLALLATPIVQLIYEKGAFDAHSTMLTSRALLAYAPGLVVFSLYKMLLPAFYARKDTRTPMLCGAAAVVGNITLNLIFVWLLPPEWKHAGLAGATIITSSANCIFLAWILYRRAGIPNWKQIGASTLRIVLCTLLMLLVLHLTQKAMPNIAKWDPTTKPGQIIEMTILISVGIATYAAALLAICHKEVRTLFAPKHH